MCLSSRASAMLDQGKQAPADAADVLRSAFELR
jgi:hypothetical protein